ncbi:MAG: MerR family transcriptional regulator [Streptosporangiaceae bacterium]
MRITEAASQLGLTPRMLRYRESLGLLPAVRHGARRRLARGEDARTAPVRAADAPSAGAPASDARTAARPPAVGRTLASGTPDRRSRAGGHRHYGEADLAAVALGLSIERRYDVSPVALAFAIRVLAEPQVRAEVAELGRRIGKIQPPPARALDFEQERALRLLRLDRHAPDSGQVRRPRPASARPYPPAN